MRIHCGDFMRIHVCDLGGFFGSMWCSLGCGAKFCIGKVSCSRVSVSCSSI